jgi:hypothetical protein
MRNATTASHHLAQVNVMRTVAPLDDAVLTEFVELLAPTNALAERSPGFVWRLPTESDDAAGVRVFEDGRILINLSVWESQQHLWNFAYASRHLDVMRRRRQWTERLSDFSLALWWLAAGRVPSLDEAAERLELIRVLGPTPAAFNFRQSFPPPERPREGHRRETLRSRPGRRSSAGNEGWAGEHPALPAQPLAR